jgi:DinB superfamily
MKAQDALKNQLSSTHSILGMYLNDLSDADFLVRPVDGANTIAWQMGHLIASEQGLGKAIPGVHYPTLPAGFAEQHDSEMAKADPSKGFAAKAQYVDLFDKTRKATIDAVVKLSEADLDKPTTGRMAEFAPTLGHLIGLLANHTMMHAGQFTCVRRKLGKPVVM